MTPLAVSQDITSRLNGNIGLVSATNLFAMEWGHGVDEQVLVLDTEGFDSDLKEIYEQPTFQILARGARNEAGATAYATARDVFEFLIAQPTGIAGASTYLQYEPLGSIAGLGRDENDRHVFSMNFFTFRSPA